MAVYTKLSENELKEFFSRYNLGKLLNHKGIEDGIGFGGPFHTKVRFIDGSNAL